MSKAVDIGNNAIVVTPIIDAKGRPIEWTDNMRRAYYRLTAKKWARALCKIPNFKSMKAEQLQAWHDEEARKGQAIKELEAHLKKKKDRSK